MIKGIDVSRWQGIINWASVKNNVQFAMIKIAGSDDGMYVDSQAVRNVVEARAHSLPLGHYFYLGGVYSPSEEVQHIKNALAAVGGLKPGEPIALDWEEHHPDEVGYMTGIVDGLGRAGLPPPLIYMSLSRVTGQNWENLVRRNCGLWVAAWGNNDSIPDATPGSDEWKFWAMWQFSSTGSVPGINGRVDLNYFNGNVAQFFAYGTKTGASLGEPTPITQPIAPAGARSEYTVVAGDNLSAIAAKFGLTWQQLWAMNRDRVSDPNKIFPSQKLAVPSAAAAPAPEAPQRRVHTVVSGENLSLIAQRYGLSNWQSLYEANKAAIGANPNFIRPGQQLTIP